MIPPDASSPPPKRITLQVSDSLGVIRDMAFVDGLVQGVIAGARAMAEQWKAQIFQAAQVQSQASPPSAPPPPTE